MQFLGKKARKAKSWLKQLSTSSEEMDLTEHDLIYFGLEKRIRKIFSNFLLALESSVVREKFEWNPCKRKTHILVLQDIFQDTYARFDTIKCKLKFANFYVLNYRKIRYVWGYGGQNIPTSSFASSEKAEGIWEIWISSELWRVTNRSILFWSSSTSWKGRGHHKKVNVLLSLAWSHLIIFYVISGSEILCQDVNLLGYSIMLRYHIWFITLDSRVLKSFIQILHHGDSSVRLG